jgi:hypothetical protein
VRRRRRDRSVPTASRRRYRELTQRSGARADLVHKESISRVELREAVGAGLIAREPICRVCMRRRGSTPSRLLN